MLDRLVPRMVQYVCSFLDTSSHLVLERCSTGVQKLCRSPTAWPAAVTVSAQFERLRDRPSAECLASLSYLRPRSLHLICRKRQRALERVSLGWLRGMATAGGAGAGAGPLEALTLTGFNLDSPKEWQVRSRPPPVRVVHPLASMAMQALLAAPLCDRRWPAAR